jgi:hypothetical protein
MTPDNKNAPVLREQPGASHTPQEANDPMNGTADLELVPSRRRRGSEPHRTMPPAPPVPSVADDRHPQLAAGEKEEQTLERRAVAFPLTDSEAHTVWRALDRYGKDLPSGGGPHRRLMGNALDAIALEARGHAAIHAIGADAHLTNELIDRLDRRNAA